MTWRTIDVGAGFGCSPRADDAGHIGYQPTHDF